MSSTATFAIRRREQTRIYFGQYMADVALPVFARGPGYAETIVTDLPQIARAVDTEAGFVLDFDRKLALLFDSVVCWDRDDARVNGWTLGAGVRADGFARLDLLPEEQCLVEILKSSESFEQLASRLQAVGLADTWRDWELRWGSRAEFVAYASDWVRNSVP